VLEPHFIFQPKTLRSPARNAALGMRIGKHKMNPAKSVAFFYYVARSMWILKDLGVRCSYISFDSFVRGCNPFRVRAEWDPYRRTDAWKMMIGVETSYKRAEPRNDDRRGYGRLRVSSHSRCSAACGPLVPGPPTCISLAECFSSPCRASCSLPVQAALPCLNRVPRRSVLCADIGAPVAQTFQGSDAGTA
jgi:hypothetical protein